MTQKVLRVGSSAAVTIPKKFLGELSWKIGDKVYVTSDILNRKILISKYKIKIGEVSKTDLEILKHVKKFFKHYGQYLKAVTQK